MNLQMMKQSDSLEKIDPYSTFDFQNLVINYQYSHCNENESTDIAFLLVHGFGANHQHWRYNIPILSQKYDAYAIDLFGFGNSSQYIEFPYNINFWSSQVNYFIETVRNKRCLY